MTSKRTTTITLRVPIETAGALREHAEREGKSLSEIASDMLGKCLARRDLSNGASEIDLPPGKGLREDLDESSEGSDREQVSEAPRELPRAGSPGDLGRSSAPVSETRLRADPSDTRTVSESSARKSYGVDWSKRPVYPGTLQDYEDGIKSGRIERGRFSPPTE